MATVTKPIALDESFNTTETPSRNIADVLASLGDAISQGAQPVTKKLATNSFKTINGGLVDGLTVQLAPVQDLHGYSKPWAGGAGKNILPCTLTYLKSANTTGVWADNVYTISDLTITVTAVEDAVTKIDVNGTASARVDFIVGDNFTLADEVAYTLSGSTNGNITDKWCIYIKFHGYNPSEMSADGEGTFTYHTGQAVTTTLVVFSGASPSHQAFYPMLRLASVADPTFEPYSNICPISGHTEAKAKINNTVYTTSLGTTVYGGDVDQVSGDGESIYGFVTLDGSETWAESGTRGYIITASNSGIMDCKQASTANTWCLSNLFERGTSTWQNGKFGIDNRTIWVNDENYETYGGLASFKAMLSGSPLTVAYELATPTSLSVTGQLITAEVGVNNVSAPLTGQSIKTDSVIYKDMFTWEDVLKVI